MITLALGAGASTAIFGAVYRELLHPLPFPEPRRLMDVRLASAWAGAEAQEGPWSYPLIAGLAERSRGFESLAAYGALDGNLIFGGEPERIQLEVVSPSYLPVLGVDPVLGRNLTPDDDHAARPVAVISHGLWQRRFAGDPGVLGTALRVDRTALTVVGVLPAGFRGLTGSAELWAPIALSPDLYYPLALTEPWNFWLRAVGRTAPGVGAAEAARETSARVAGIAQEHPLPMEVEVAWGAAVEPLAEARTPPELRRGLLLLFAASAFVVLIAGANLAALTLVRVQARCHDSAVRLALGCSRSGLAGQTLAETLLLAVGGGLAGLLVYGALHGAVDGLDTAALAAAAGGPTEWLDLTPVRGALLVVLFNFGLALVAGVLFGAVPAMRATRLDPVTALRQTAGGTGGCRLRGRTVLAVTEVALAVVLVFGAGWMAHSSARLLDVERGFSASDRVLTFWIEPPRGSYAAGLEAAALQRDLIERLRGLPAVEAVSVDKCSPLSGECPSTVVTYVEGRPRPALDAAPQVELHYVGPDHFRLLGVPVLAGRTFSRRDEAGAPRVVLVNRTAADRLFGSTRPIGRRLALANGLFRDEGATAEVVGVVDDVRYGPPAEPIEPAVYLSALQYSFPSTQVLVRSAGDPLALTEPIRRTVLEIDSGLPIFEIRTLAERIRLAFMQPLTGTLLLGFFALLALILAGLGVYGVIAFSIARRVRELGIRIALGAGSGQVIGMVLGRTLTIVAVGLALGTFGAIAFGRLLESMLYGVELSDPLTFVVVAVLLVATALLAAYLPARRALRIDPVSVLRQD